MKHNSFFKRSSKTNSQLGAAFVELLIVFLIAMTIIGACFYFAIAYYRYSMLVSAGSSSLRRFAVETGINRSQTGVDSWLESEKRTALQSDIRSRLQSMFGIASASASDVVIEPNKLTACVEHLPTSVCKIRAEVKWKAPCYFFCSFFKVLDIGTTLEANIEDFCFSDPWTNFQCPCQSGGLDFCDVSP